MCICLVVVTPYSSSFPTSELNFPFACDVIQGHSCLPQSLHRCLQARYISQVRILAVTCYHMLYQPYITHISPIYHPYITHISPRWPHDPKSTYLCIVTKECSWRCSPSGGRLGKGPQGLAHWRRECCEFPWANLDWTKIAFFGWDPPCCFFGWFSSHATIFGLV